MKQMKDYFIQGNIRLEYNLHQVQRGQNLIVCQML